MGAVAAALQGVGRKVKTARPRSKGGRWSVVSDRADNAIDDAFRDRRMLFDHERSDGEGGSSDDEASTEVMMSRFADFAHGEAEEAGGA